MALAPGTHVGVYEVTGALGAGGMGEVYLAADTRLGRKVALKILSDAFAGDAERLARFEREAKTLAALNHPHIAQIHGFDVAPPLAPNFSPAVPGAKISFLVMELVEGDTLADWIARGPVPFDEAVSIARQISEALEAAHDQGIIHRDLKPANVKVRPDGAVKVLDFGLAKALDGAGGASNAVAVRGPGVNNILNSATITSPAMTHAGVILGAAAYMSPEQAKGKPVDRRADIWAFGCILFEMLTAHRLFDGDTVAETLARVIEREPDLTQLPTTTPPAVRALIARCLQRDPKRRLRDIGEARIALEHPMDALPAGATPAAAARAARGRLALAVVAAAAVSAGATALIMRAIVRPAAPMERRFTLPTPNDAAPLLSCISPDGSKLLIIAEDKLWLQKLDTFSVSAVTGSDGAHAPFWSPDSSAFGFQARGQLWTVARDADPVSLARVPEFTFAGGAAWLGDGRIVYATGGTGLFEIPANGGEPKPFVTLDPAREQDIHNVSALDAQSLLYSVHPTAGNYTIEMFETATATRRTIFTGTTALISHTVYSPTGHVLFELPTGVWALPFSLRDRRAAGEAFLVLPNARQPSVARDGTLVMLPNSAAASDARLAWIDRSGKTLRMLGDARGHLRQPRLSPDGRFIAFVRGSGAYSDVWIYDVTRAAERQLTFESTADFWPVWSSDSRHIVYHCNNAVCARRADGAGAPVQLVDAPATEPSVSRDDRWLAFAREVRPGEPDIFAVDLTATGFTQRATATPRLVIAAPRVQVGPEISPDGRYVAYTSSEGGPFATFVSQFPSGEGKWQVPLGFSQLPRWSVKGDRLYVLDELRRIVELPVDLSASFEIGAPLTRISNNSLIGGYDVSRDGNEFLLPVAPANALASGRLLVVQNWKGQR